MKRIDAALARVSMDADLTERQRIRLLNGFLRDIIDATCPFDWGLAPKCTELHQTRADCVDCWLEEMEATK